jgi:Tol biopolymer transport system component
VVLYFTDTGVAHRVSPAGGECLSVKWGDESLRGSLPEFLPDGNHFFFLGAKSVDSSIRGVYIGSLDGAKPRKVLNDYSSVLYSPPLHDEASAHLLFLRASTVMAQPFDPDKLEAVGDPFAVATPASISLTPNQMAASVANGTLVYLSSRPRNLQLTWFDRSGKELGKLGEPAERAGISLSPDGNMVAFRERTQTDPLGGIGLSDLIRNSESRFTPDGRTATAAVWSPDGAHIVYSAPDGTGTNLFMRNANGDGPETRLLPSGPNIRNASDWSADGRFLIYTEFEPKTGSHVWYLPNPGKPDAIPVRLLSPDAVGTEGQLSPDGHWIAYSSSPDVAYVRAFPSGDRLTKIAGNAIEPRWSKNGRELFYLEFVNGAVEVNLMQVTFSAGTGGSPQIGEPRKIMQFPSRVILPQNNLFAYSPHPDGKRFLVNVRSLDASSEINLITNWQKLSGSAKP